MRLSPYKLQILSCFLHIIVFRLHLHRLIVYILQRAIANYYPAHTILCFYCFQHSQIHVNGIVLRMLSNVLLKKKQKKSLSIHHCHVNIPQVNKRGVSFQTSSAFSICPNDFKTCTYSSKPHILLTISFFLLGLVRRWFHCKEGLLLCIENPIKLISDDFILQDMVKFQGLALVHPCQFSFE